jgi:hypothetical protein
VDGKTKQNRRLVAKRRLAVEPEMEELVIPHQDETLRGFQQNLVVKIYKQGSFTPTANLPSILLGFLNRANQPTSAEHIL